MKRYLGDPTPVLMRPKEQLSRTQRVLMYVTLAVIAAWAIAGVIW